MSFRFFGENCQGLKENPRDLNNSSQILSFVLNICQRICFLEKTSNFKKTPRKTILYLIPKYISVGYVDYIDSPGDYILH